MAFLLTFFISAIAFSFELKGVARSLDGKSIIYFEQHQIELDAQGFNKKIETRYSKSDGTQFAIMISDFSKNKLVPEIKFEDSRFNKKEDLNLGVDGKVLFKQKIGDKPLKTKEVIFAENMAAGQGFDNFIKMNFDQLLGNEVPLQFGVLSEMDFFSFNAYRKSSDNQNAQFGISLKNPFLRLFLRELVLTYDVEKKRIKTFRGLSNILDDQQKTQNVQIEYEIAKP